MRRLLAVTVMCSLIVGVPVVMAQDDGGSGQDAPDRREDALEFPGTRLTGRLDDANGDSADWYLLTGLPKGKGVAVSLTVSGINGAIIYLYDENGDPFVRTEDGQVISGYRLESSWSSSARYEFEILPSPGPFYLGIVRDFWSNNGTYDFRFDIVDLADLTVDTPYVSPVDVQSDAGPLPVSVVRTVRVEVGNQGEAAAPARVDAWVAPVNDPTASKRHLGTVTVDLGVGDRTTLTFEWSTLGQAGDVDVWVRASTKWETSLDDNSAATRQFVHAGSIGLGVDALNHRVDAADASAGTSHGSGTGAGVTLPVLGTTTVGGYTA